MLLPFLAILFGLALLVWSAHRFVEGSADTARYFGLPPLLIGMVIVGFGTSAPEMVVSVLAASQGNPGIALGNAYGSNITNIALILGLTALISPITVDRQVWRRELPILTVITGLAAWQVWDGKITHFDAFVLLTVFIGIMGWNIHQGLKKSPQADSPANEGGSSAPHIPLKQSLIKLGVGLVLLILSSRILVWGAVEVARGFGVSDLIIGLTVVAVGTSLPELASSLIATRKGEHDIALGNVLGSNLFNTLAVVGLAAAIQPMTVGPEFFNRDVLVMGALTLILFLLCFGFKRPAKITSLKGTALVLIYVGYTVYLATTVF